MYLNDKICGYVLDEQQQSIVLDENKYLLVVAGAGSGKTLTILGKIYYLVQYQNVLPQEILCISFTKASSDSLRAKIKKEFGISVPVYTFHKLSLEILKNSDVHYSISASETLELVIEEFFSLDILNFPKYMKWVLEYFRIYNIPDIKERYQNFYVQDKLKLQSLQHLISTFISLFKCNHHILSDFSLFLKCARKTIFYFNYRKEKIFLILTLNVYLKYQTYLKDNHEIDFNDMITLATEWVDIHSIDKKYQYIMIDEYQDTSLLRFRLIQSILKVTSSRLMVVGDDFQSIYRFTGCDLSLFLNFSSYFEGATIKRIESTYRNSQELVTVAGNFVMKNKNQIHKNLSSDKHLDKPIKIFYYHDMKNDFITFLEKINQVNQKPIMILGRNNHDIYKVLRKQDKITDTGKIIISELTDLELYYLTAHKSKGLEEENVVIINLVKDQLGFPNNITDNQVLRFVSLKQEKYPFAEERRLFYVALTRTKNAVYLYAPKKRISPFVKELLHHYKDTIEIMK